MVSRRRLLIGGATAVGGVLAGAAAASAAPLPFTRRRLPIDGGYAPAGNPSTWTLRGEIRTVWHIPSRSNAVALTFDDGPSPQWTPYVLETLAALNVQATFFVVGKNLQAHKNLAQYAGHEVGNHTWSHADLAQLDERGVMDEVHRCHDLIGEVTGRPPNLLRPPWGHVGGSTLLAADSLGYDIVLWSQRMPENEYRVNPAGIVPRVVGEARPGAIMLAHDTGPSDRLITLKNLGGIVEGLRARGFQFLTVSQLFTTV